MKKVNYSFWQKLIPPTLLSILTVIIYYPSLFYGFLYDDMPQITNNINIIKGASNPFALLFANNRWIARFFNCFIYKHWKTNPFPYHLFGLILHLLIGVMIFFLLLKLFSELKNESASFLKKNAYLLSTFASGMFLLYPIQTQTVPYITQMQLEGLVTFFVFSILLLFVYAAKAKNFYLKVGLYSCAYLFTFVSAGTKEIIVVLPFLIILVDWFFVAQGDYKKFLYRLPIHAMFFIVLAGSLFYLKFDPIKTAVHAQAPLSNNRGNVLTAVPEAKITSYLFFISQFKIILHYIWLYFWPSQVCFDYNLVLSKTIFDYDVIFPFLAIFLILLTTLFLFIKNRTNIFSFCVAWFFITVLPRASIFPSTELVCDYKTYLASFGILLFITILLFNLIKFLTNALNNILSLRYRKSFYQTSFIFVLFLVFGVSTRIRNTVWSSELAFWEDVIKKVPNRPRGYNNYGVALSERRRIDEAIIAYKKSAELDPTYAEPIINIAFNLQAQGKKDEAMQYYQKALTMKEVHPEMYHNLGVLYFHNGDHQRAKNCFDLAIKYRYYYSSAHYALGTIYQMEKNYPQAFACYENAINGDKQEIDYFYKYGLLAQHLGYFDKAVNGFENVKKMNQNHKDTIWQLGCCYYNLRKYDKAAQNFKIVYKQNQNDGLIAYNYAQSLLNLGKYQKALPLFEQCKGEKDNYPFAQLHLAKCLNEIGNKDLAKEELHKLILDPPNQYVKSDAVTLLMEMKE